MTEVIEKFLFGSMWRSEDMVLIQMTMQREAAHDTAEQLGDLGLVEFKDLSAHLSAFQRNYANEVRRCEELERKIRYVEEQLKSMQGDLQLSYIVEQEGDIADLGVTLDSLETLFDDYEQELRHLNENLEHLEAEKINNQEMRHVIQHGEAIFKLAAAEGGDILPSNDVAGSEKNASLLDNEHPSGIGPASESSHLDAESQLASLGYLTGVVTRDKVPAFNLLLYRATRGNMIPRFTEIEEPMEDTRTGKMVEKNVFIVFFGANRAREKIKKICESVGASIHDFPQGDASRAYDLLMEKINDLDNTIASTNDRKKDILSEISIHIDKWKKKVAKEKALFHTMNMFDYSIGNSVIAEGWCPRKVLDEVIKRMKIAEESSNALVESFCEELHTTEVPPTYNESNQFTECFQNIVDSYGVPRYKEANPALPSLITFPFLFAVMFSDFGHGIMLTLFALAMVLFQGKLKSVAEKEELFGMIFYGRYVILLMGLFTIYTGILYNDAFGHAFEIFGASAYDFDPTTGIGQKVRATYPIGVDPAWYGTANKLDYYNSLKMKMSIVFGVSHMMLGIFMGFCNQIHYRKFFHVLAQTIPEVLILGCTFGYMAFMIVYKWCVPWFDIGAQPPSLLNTMTDFFLSPWAMKEPPLFPGQQFVQLGLVLIAAIAIPWLFLPLPIYEIFMHKRKNRKRRYPVSAYEEEADAEAHSPIMAMSLQDAEYGQLPSDDDIGITVEQPDAGVISSSPYQAATPDANEKHVEGTVEVEAEGEPFIPSEIVIQQMIHTIEFALGAVSNTASYLRLWALSLAHAQLSEVFWDMTWGIVLNIVPFDQLPWIVNALVVFVGIAILFHVWLMMTFGVLLCLECLSAFLHSLRLHWVEFQTKFYLGDGRAFEAFDLKRVVKEAAVQM